ncbi:Crp/Fnr family transcriptional regulator [Tsuneonella mangrovi]|uniref:Crp/Fnr family transcriptional regulator n=1 Tax=Tsuneonella mangrovi TaxID=1982042 RepID=UPI000BA1F9C9|nr:Crp/Fnr family transcriptional regulator [Tsuneonella mangrovi]
MARSESEFLDDALSSSPIFGLLPPEERAAFGKTASRIHCRERTVLAGYEVSPDSLYLVAAGQIELTAHSFGGSEVTIAAIGPGNWATWLAIYDDSPLSHAIVAAPGTRLFALPTRAVRNAVATTPECYPEIIRQVGNRFRSLLDWVENSALADRERRLAHLLLVLADTSGGDSRTVFLTRERIAQLMGCSRQTLHDTFGKLAARGLAKSQYSRVTLPDRAALQAFARSGD